MKAGEEAGEEEEAGAGAVGVVVAARNLQGQVATESGPGNKAMRVPAGRAGNRRRL